MKKALWLIAALVLALVLVTGCDQESIEISKLPQGSDNFDFEGKTLVQLAPNYDDTYTINKSSVAGASYTYSDIELVQETRTYAFAEDGNYTYTYVRSFTPTADGQYVTGAVAGVSYSDDYYLNGFAGKVISQTVTTGTWYQYKDKNSGTPEVTKILMMDDGTSTTTYTGIANFASSTTLVTYSAGTPTVHITNNTVGDPNPVPYGYDCETADGQDVWIIDGEAYVVQE